METIYSIILTIPIVLLSIWYKLLYNEEWILISPKTLSKPLSVDLLESVDTLKEENNNVVLVTGGCGFLASHIVEQLCTSTFDVIRVFDVVDKPSFKPKLPAKNSPIIEYVVGDITNLKDVLKATHGVSAVMHTAAVVDLREDGKSRTKLNRVNVVGTWNILRACLHHKIKNIVYTSSGRCIKTYLEDNIVDEEDFEKRLKGPTPSQGYSRSKFEATNFILEAGKTYDIHVSVLIPSVIFGPGDVRYTETIVKDKEYMCNPQKNIQSFVCAASLAKAHVLALQNMIKTPDLYSKRPQVYLISDFVEDMKVFYNKVCIAHGLNSKDKKNMWPFMNLIILASYVYNAITLGTKNSPFLQLTNQSKHYMTSSMPFGTSKKAISQLGWKPMPLETSLELIKVHLKSQEKE